MGGNSTLEGAYPAHEGAIRRVGSEFDVAARDLSMRERIRHLEGA